MQGTWFSSILDRLRATADVLTGRAYAAYSYPDHMDEVKLRILLMEAEGLLGAFVQHEVEYMTVNHLGDPEKQHNVKWARSLLAKIAAAVTTGERESADNG